MRNLLAKEFRLSAHILSYLFIAFGAMAMIPGYPITLGAFFVCLGLFQTFQAARENNDVLFTALLPVAKTDVVRARYAFVVCIELASFLLMAVLTILRMTVLADAAVYVNNAMMNANQVFLAWVLVIFALFNVIFVGGFFKTAYKFGKPFVVFIVVSFVVVAVAEALHFFPGLAWLNATATMGNGLMWGILAAAVVLFALVTWLSLRRSCTRFEAIDL